MPIDYRELLLKYIRHVGTSEGVTFLEGIGERGRDGTHPLWTGPFTEEEAAELRKLDDEAFPAPKS